MPVVVPASLRRAAATPLAVDGAIALVLTVMAQVQAGSGTPLVDRLLLLVITATVTFRRRYPVASTVAVAVAAAAMALTSQQPSVFGEYLAIMLMAYTVAERTRLTVAILAGVLLAGGIVAHDLAAPDLDSVGSIGGDLVTPVLAWGVGRIVHFQNRRTDRAERSVETMERDRDELARLAVQQERRQIARELHDVVAHSVSVVVIQAQGAQRILGGTRPDVGRSLRDIESAGRTALTEMRRLVGLLREEDDAAIDEPQPSLAEVPVLMDRVRSAGLAVTLTDNGGPTELGAGAQLSAYRVIQEALTNALKYARDAAVAVQIDRRPDAVDVLITDDGGASESDLQGGRGLLGMRERVSVFGGTLDAGPQPHGGFRVHASLPIRERDG